MHGDATGVYLVKGKFVSFHADKRQVSYHKAWRVLCLARSVCKLKIDNNQRQHVKNACCLFFNGMIKLTVSLLGNEEGLNKLN